jgi:hypothetical protein
MRIVQARHLIAEGFTPTGTLNYEETFALDELFDDVTLSWMKASGDVKAFFEERFRRISNL